MKSLLPKQIRKRVRRKSHRGSAVFYALMVTISLMWIELLYRFYTTQNILNGDVIHILLINATIAFVFVTLLSFIPSLYHRITTVIFLLAFVVAAPVFSTLTLSHVQYAQLDFLINTNLFDLYQSRYESFIRPGFLLYGLVFSWLLIPFRIRRQAVSTIGLLIVSSGLVIGTFFYLINPRFANTTENTNNWEILIYQENPGISRSRLGINQATLRTILNRPLFIRPLEEDVLGEISRYLEENDTTSRNASVNLRNKNLVIIQVEGLTYRAFNEEVMPFTTGEFYDNSVRFVNYYADQKEIDNYGLNFSLLTGIPTIPTAGNTVHQFANNNYPFGLGAIFASEGYNTASFFQYYANREDVVLENTGFLRQFDYFDFSSVVDNDVDFVREGLPLLFRNRSFLAYFNLNNPHANREIQTVPTTSMSITDSQRDYFSKMYTVDQAIEAAYNLLEDRDLLDNTAIMVVGTNPYLDDIELSRPGRILQYKVPMLIYTGQEGEEIDAFMGPVDMIPSIMSMYRFTPDNQYLGSNVFVRTDNVVAFHDGSWITKEGHYDALTQRFAVNQMNASQDSVSNYVRDTMYEVQQRYRIARLILERNYYGVESI